MIDIPTIFKQVSIEAKRVPRSHREPLPEARTYDQDVANCNEMIKRREWNKPHRQHIIRIELFNKLSLTDQLTDDEFDVALNEFGKLSRDQMLKELK